jgi:transposase
MLAFIDLEERVPMDHPLRTIKRLADEALAGPSSTFDGMYAENGRPSIPPERLLKASLLIALYSVRSERAFCEQLDYNLLHVFQSCPGSVWVRARTLCARDSTGFTPWA